jgi:hypothetical protein
MVEWCLLELQRAIKDGDSFAEKDSLNKKRMSVVSYAQLQKEVIERVLKANNLLE